MWKGGVRVIVLDEENRMLLVRQRHGEKDIWMVPGGGIEEGESAVEAAVREVKEETMLDVAIDGLIWHVEEVSGRGQRFVNFFRGHLTCPGGKPVLRRGGEEGRLERVRAHTAGTSQPGGGR